MSAITAEQVTKMLEELAAIRVLLTAIAGVTIAYVLCWIYEYAWSRR